LLKHLGVCIPYRHGAQFFLIYRSRNSALLMLFINASNTPAVHTTSYTFVLFLEHGCKVGSQDESERNAVT